MIGNKTQPRESLNKAFQELVLYFLREHLTEKI